MITEKEIEQQKAIIIIKHKFDEKIKDYNSKYSVEDQLRFSDKRMCAEITIHWGDDLYIKLMAESKWVTELQYAQYIMSKVNEFKEFYATEEIARNTAIAQVMAS